MAVITSSRPVTAPRFIIAGLTLAAAAVILAGWALAAQAVPGRAITFGSFALAAWCAGLLCVAGAREGDLGLARWKLGPWLLAWSALTDGVATAAWNPGPDSVIAQVSDTSVLRALWLLAAAVTCAFAGYLAGPGPLRTWTGRAVSAVAARRAGTVRGPLTPWIMYAAGTAARLADLAMTGHLGYVGSASAGLSGATGYSQVITDLGYLAPLAVAAAALQAYREHRPGARVTLAILAAAELAWGVLAAQKQDFIVVVLAVAIPAAAARGRMPKTVMAAAAALFLVVVIPYTLTYRAAARGGVTTLTASQAAARAPGILAQTATSGQLLGGVPASLTYLLQRVQNIGPPALIMQRTPSGGIPYASPVQLIEAPLAELIPRALWPGKPVLDTGYQVSQDYYGEPSDVYSTAAVTPAGDLWRHGGWVPVIAGMFLLGCAVRLLDDVLDIRANPHAVFLLVLLFPLVKSEEDWTGLVAGVPALFAVWLLAVMLAFRKQRAA
jgi:hypothetical protein